MEQIILLGTLLKQFVSKNKFHSLLLCTQCKTMETKTKKRTKNRISKKIRETLENALLFIPLEIKRFVIMNIKA